MESFKPVALLLLCLLSVTTTVTGWGVDGHFATCKIAQGRLSQAAADAVNHLLPEYAEGDLATLCSWADHVKCVAGAINNYTTQLLDYGKQTSQYNLTEALLFLSHFIGDIHQPLHVGFTTDRGGNTIDVHWFTRKAVLHHVWDDSIIETAEERFYNSDVETLIDAIQINITNEWADQVQIWERCSRSQTTCPNIYATEGIKAACNWAYKGVGNDSVLGDEYFLSRLPIVNWRLAQGGVRLAATLNRIFG
ncbi:Phospholipase C/P1 nuclease domain-containing protein [Cynara cardunculus var. scolymus]|uniref:Aspergillus nuclease S1 n=1 Tax=Cynara cardunculus var. scolymus TaxID=59895 RepID=A0A103XVE6_CYNCS|nr:Phospholipase C/P1 nuclease domain-containing protein [Cynara cardunculus var. scolymus]